MKISRQQQKQAIDAYLGSNITITEIATKYQVTPSAIGGMFRRKGVPIRSDARYRKYSFDVDKFDIIDTEEKAYWIGFLLGDASINANNNALYLELSQIDRPHIEKFCRFLSANHPIKPKRKDCCVVVISGKAFVSKLSQYGIVRAKSKTTKTPKIDHLFLTDFYRGILDADGWITEHKMVARNPQHEFGFSSGSEVLLMEIKKWLITKIGHFDAKIVLRQRTGSSVYQLVIGGNRNFKKLVDLFYPTPCCCLNRKYEKAHRFLVNLCH